MFRPHLRLVELVRFMSFLQSLKRLFSRPIIPENSDDDHDLGTANTNSHRNFSADYNAAARMIKTKMDARYPDNYRAGFERDRGSTIDYGSERAEAVDTTSATIAAALRNGATVKQAAEAAAKSVGI